jgi:hypothetical protein
LKVVCAWCKKEIVDAPENRDFPVSHGICEACAFHVKASMGMPLVQFLGGLSCPVVVSDAEGRIIGANADAEKILQKKADEINGVMGGLVFECEYAYLPEGCGNTDHCAGCAIRNTVMDTLATGHNYTKKSVSLKHRQQGPLSVRLSTERAGKAVLIRIDEITREPEK